MTFPQTCFVAMVALAAVSLRAQVTTLQDDAPPDAKTLKDQVKAFAKAREQKKFEFLERTRQELLKPIQTSGAAGNYVIDCMRTVQYEGKEGGNAQFAEWKKNNRGMFSNRDFERASDLYLRYLALTLRRATLKSAEPLQAEIWNYLELLNSCKDLVANVMRENTRIKMTVYDPKQDKVTGEILGNIEDTKLVSAENTHTFVQDLLNQAVSSGLVAQALKLTGHLDEIPEWELVPGNFSGIMELDVRPLLRLKKDPKLLSTWDYEIAFTAAVVDLKKEKKEQEKFRRETYPKLVWKKAADAELLGLKNRALNIRLDIARKYPEHPDFDGWAKQIEAELTALKSEQVPEDPEAAKTVQPLPAADETAGPKADSPFGITEPSGNSAMTPAAVP